MQGKGRRGAIAGCLEAAPAADAQPIPVIYPSLRWRLFTSHVHTEQRRTRGNEWSADSESLIRQGDT
ncbi:hypothetical protein A7D17_00505 [Xanthomonas floridensis]|uniref:Uncharacterized protein n=1 Tax=Xanthomonas floridensis TaxID=1843580 RepID=A0A1A9MGC4_9XANT|nr:hypothetical protein A7D17_00505 [Xanthomonas floridensis]